ncbi:MAG: PAS domain S-box protein [Spirochaetes bacterium]|nr:PAS domain S-box protein [Spirochaetota bacterium]
MTGIVGIGRDITTRKLAETEVEEANRRLEFILGAARTGLDIIDANHSMRYVDPEWQKVYGDPKGRKCYEYFMGAQAVCPECGIMRALTTRQPTVSEEVLPKEGNRSVQVTTIPFQDENGQWLAAEVNVDITERKRAEAALQAAKEYADNLIQTANVMVVGLDINGKITVFNKAAEQISGYSLAELENRNWFEVIVPRSRYPEVWARFERWETGGFPRNIENPILTKSGEERYVVWQNNEVREGGRIVGSISFGMDITERRRAEEKNLLLAALVESSDDAIVGLNLNRIITSWNRGAERVYGYSAEEIIGRPTSLLIPPDLENEARSIRERINRGEALDHFETLRRRKDGTLIDVSLSLSPIWDTEGKLIGQASIARDITEQKKIQAQLMRVQKLESLSALAGGIGHQFNNINAVINGYLEILAREENLPERAKTYIHAAQQGVHRAAEITDRLLVLTGSSQARRESIRLDELARSRVALLDTQFETEGISVRLDLCETVTIEAVSSPLGFLLTSLLTNALHSLIEGPLRVVTVRTGSVSGFAFLEVSDTGCGIAPENLTRIFTPFFTTKGEFAAAGSAQAKVKGVGLSLAVCQAIVSEYGGRIDVESQLGTGSTFRVRFPTAAAGA